MDIKALQEKIIADSDYNKINEILKIAIVLKPNKVRKIRMKVCWLEIR